MKPYVPPIAVGVLLFLYGIGLWLMSGGEANPALVLLAFVLGAAAVAWGLHVRSRSVTPDRAEPAAPRTPPAP